MPRPCSICHHPDRLAIDAALAAKEPYRSIAEHFETSPAALRRHQQSHTKPHASGGPPRLSAAVAGSNVASEAQRLHEAALSLAYHPVRVLAMLREMTAVLVRLTNGETAPAPVGDRAVVDAAARLHTTARDVHRQTRDLRSTHQPEVLERIEDLARILVEVTGLLAVHDTTPQDTAHPRA